MDLMMPRMSGVEAIRHLRQLKVTKDIPILVLSAYQEQALIDEAMQAGADDYLIKTILPEDLTDVIDRYLEIGSAVLSRRLVRMRDEGA
jgi:CheY-like chemotaxis protein